MKNVFITMTVFMFLCLTPAAWAAESPEPADTPAVPAEVPVRGMVTMIDLGAKKCIPCKMMAPILEKLKKEYEGRAAIVFIDIWEDQTQTPKYGLKAIPTQIFFNENGEEVSRHQGFMSEDAIVSQLKKMGVN